MRRLFIVPVLVALLAAMSGRVATAAYCGAVSYDNCGGCAEGSGEVAATHTVMKTVRKTVYEQRTEQRTRTEYQTVSEDKVINVTRMVPETRYRTVNQVVRKPVYETKTRNYTVMQIGRAHV